MRSSDDIKKYIENTISRIKNIREYFQSNVLTNNDYDNQLKEMLRNQLRTEQRALKILNEQYEMETDRFNWFEFITKNTCK